MLTKEMLLKIIQEENTISFLKKIFDKFELKNF